MKAEETIFFIEACIRVYESENFFFLLHIYSKIEKVKKTNFLFFSIMKNCILTQYTRLKTNNPNAMTKPIPPSSILRELIGERGEEESFFVKKENYCTLLPSVYRRKREDQMLVKLADLLSNNLDSEIIEAVRKEEYHSARQKEMKRRLGAWIASEFDGNADSEHLLRRAGFFVIDVDAKDNPWMTNQEKRDALKKWLGQCPFVAYVGESASGVGLFIIVALSVAVSDDERERIYKAFCQFLKNNPHDPLITDDKCIDICHLRYNSADYKPYINRHPKNIHRLEDLEEHFGPLPVPSEAEAKVDLALKPVTTPVALNAHEQCHTASQAFPDNLSPETQERLRRKIDYAKRIGAHAFETHDEKRAVGYVLSRHLGEKGRQLCHDLLELSSNYNKDITDVSYDWFVWHPGNGSIKVHSLFAILNRAINSNKPQQTVRKPTWPMLNSEL